MSVLVENGTISWIRPTVDEGERPADCEVVDAGGATIVPGLVDGHSHLTFQGGSHWIDRGADPTEVLLKVAETNGELLHRTGCGGLAMWVRYGATMAAAGSGRWPSVFGTDGRTGGTGRTCARREPGSARGWICWPR